MALLKRLIVEFKDRTGHRQGTVLLPKNPLKAENARWTFFDFSCPQGENFDRGKEQRRREFFFNISPDIAN